jgi:Uma2 family endonuclease
MNRLSTIPPFTGAQPYRMAAPDYIRLILAGGFGDAHVELVEGELVEMSPAGLEHSGRNADIVGDLVQFYKPLGYRLHIDAIVELSENTVRAPDIAVVDRNTGDRKHLLPADILLAVEISDTTLTEDLGRKRIDYAASGIRHYWVVDVEGRRIHCYENPQGVDYATIQVIAFGEPVPVPETAGTITIA